MPELEINAGMRISVALCTFNGANYLSQQLHSLMRQSRRPDEVVVCDDNSTDDTLKLLQSFHEKAPFPVILHVNQINLGSTQNFSKAIGLCSGDVVVLADQDDVWSERKLEVLEKQFIEKTDMGLVFSNAEVVNENLRPLPYTLWEHVGFDPSLQKMIGQGHALEALLKHYVVTGATMGFSARFKELLLPIPEGWVHDAWIALLISACSKLAFVDDPLVLYRQHSGNQIGAKRTGLLNRYKNALVVERTRYYQGEIERYQAAKERLKQFPQCVHSDAFSLLDEKLAHLRYRSLLPDARVLRIPYVLSELIKFKYRRFSFSWQVAVKDLLIPADLKNKIK